MTVPLLSQLTSSNSHIRSSHCPAKRCGLTRRVMLTESEKHGCRELLHHVAAADLRSILDTVCMKKVTATSKEEAIKAIITFTVKPIDLLRRKKLKKDYLWSYLNHVGVNEPPSSEKLVLINKALQHWGSQMVSQEQYEQMDCGESAVSEPLPHQRPPTAHPSVDSQLAVHFSDWFYSMLNSYHPSAPDKSKQDFGCKHFFEDSLMKLQVISPNSISEEHRGAQAICERFIKFPCEELVLFNPNLDSDGYKAMSDPHGLKRLMVCGTVHKQDGSVVGLFEQQFGLVRDPLKENNWKIKLTNLRLQAGSGYSKPSLRQASQALGITFSQDGY